jgi:DNA-binding Lrp family transcriptional regulator
MDHTDISLIMMLLQDSRTPYRDLAERLGLSVNAVHRRIQELVNAGVIRTFNTKIKLEAFGGASLLANGRYTQGDTMEKCREIGAHEYTYWVTIAGDNKLYMGVYLPTINDLEKYLGFLKEHGVTNIQHGIEPITDYRGEIKLSDLDQLDYQILSYLQNDARMNISDIAALLDVSARTVRRRLTAITDSGLIDFSLEWYPSASADIISILDLTLSEGNDKDHRRWEIFMNHSPHILYPFSFLNVNDTLSLLVWTDTMRTLQSLSSKLLDERDVVNVTPNILYDGFIFETWRDTHIRENASPA